MGAVKRLSKEERKKEIMQSAAKVIIEKGFSKTTMEDIIAGTTMSKGGVYHYYGNTMDILADLMISGMEYRNKVIFSHLDEYQKGCEVEFLAKQLVQKMIDDNFYMPIYVQFLIEKKRNPKLELLFQDLKKKTLAEFSNILKDDFNVFPDMATFDFMTDFMNAIILASDVLDARESFATNRQLLEEMTVFVLKKTKR